MIETDLSGNKGVGVVARGLAAFRRFLPGRKDRARELPVDESIIAEKTKAVFDEMLQVFTGVPVTPYPNRERYYVTTHTYQLQVIADSLDRISQGANEQLDGQNGVTLITLTPVEGRDDLRATYELTDQFRFTVHGSSRTDRSYVRFVVPPGETQPHIEFAGDNKKYINEKHSPTPEQSIELAAAIIAIAKSKKSSG